MSVTIITYYYLIKSKFPPAQYIKWINNFLKIQTNMVIFTNKKTYDLLFCKIQRKNIIFKILEFEQFEVYKYNDYLKKDLKRDHEGKRHSIELYSIWNNKCHFMELVIKENPFKTEWFFACDIGSFRDSRIIDKYQNWPKISKLNKLDKSKVHLLLIEPFTKKELELKKNEFYDFSKVFARIAGGFLIGKKEAILKWKKTFFKTLEEMIKINMFIGKDQNIINICYLHNRVLVNLIKAKQINSSIWSKWWWLSEYLN